AVGADGDDFGANPDVGSVSIVSGSDCSFVRKCADPQAAFQWLLGSDVAAVGDLTGDGRPEVAATAPGATTSYGSKAGEVTVFDPTNCAVVRRLVDPLGADQVGMGRSVAGMGDVNGDGKPDIAVGSYQD